MADYFLEENLIRIAVETKEAGIWEKTTGGSQLIPGHIEAEILK